MAGPTNIEWLNQNSLRAYPIKENTSRVPIDGDGNPILEAALPNSLIVDFVLTVPGTVPTGVYLKQLAYVGNLLTFVFADAVDAQIAVVGVNTDSHVTYQGYTLAGTGDYSDAIGRLVLGDLTNLAQVLAEGIYNFQLTTTPMEDCTLRPMLRGVRSLRVVTEQNESDYIYGHVKLLAGDNIRLTYLPVYNAIRIDAIDGGGLNEECACVDQIGRNNCVRTINGIPVEDVTIIGDGQCVNVEVDGNNIVISDVCSSPCCGCPELEFVTETLKVLEASVSNLEAYAQQLADRINTFVTNYILTIAG
jgi:hypothetical protein